MEESKETIRDTGLGIVMTTIFIAGQMAGGGVLMLPGAMVSTGRKEDDEELCGVYDF